MKFVRPLNDIFGQRSKVELLRFLVRTRAEHTGRELSRFLGLDPKTCHAALQDLARQGVVEHRKIGTAIAYKLNERHVLVRRILEPVFETEDGLLEAYANDLRKRAGIPLVSMILFGSVARGEERPASDVDVVLVTPAGGAGRERQEALDRAATELAGTYGNPPQVMLFSRREFSRKAAARDSFVSEVLRTGRVLYGKPFSQLLKHGA
ncbi:MAG: nucleotidyltransferase domain-containing protein [Planctomycetes bacterium]|nr:nucleotidyltransferase domain-containing protein [Planctomycetota bacterium]